MNPSLSSNAEPPAGVTYKVSTRALTAELDAARVEESTRDLGSVDPAGLAALLEKLASLDPSEVHDADPHLVATGRRGRFSIRPARGGFLLRSTTEIDQSFVELTAADVPCFLDGRDALPAVVSEEPGQPAVALVNNSKRTVALALFALAGLLVGFSAWLTFRPAALDPDSDYEGIAATEAGAQRASVLGTYVSGGGDEERILEFTPAGIALYREYGANRVINIERQGAFTVVRRRADKTVVVRVRGLGPVELQNAGTMVFAHDVYARRPAAGAGIR